MRFFLLAITDVLYKNPRKKGEKEKNDDSYNWDEDSNKESDEENNYDSGDEDNDNVNHETIFGDIVEDMMCQKPIPFYLEIRAALKKARLLTG
jgi:hypothetical protein